MFEEIIEKLLTLKSSLATAKEQKIIEAMQNIEQEFADKEVKIDKMLNECGYVAPAEEIQVTDLDNNA
jgi:hypothetical protein